MANDPKSVRLALARCVAKHDVSDDAVDHAAKLIATARHQIRGIGVCELGICIDYITDKKIWEVLPELAVLEGARLRNIEVFPWGIIDPDLFHVRVTQEIEGLVGLQV